jgi:nucleoside 2-deoxyribosyltransferase
MRTPRPPYINYLSRFNPVRTYMAGPIFEPGADELQADIAIWRQAIFGPYTSSGDSGSEYVSWDCIGRFYYAGPSILRSHGAACEVNLVDACLKEVAAADVVFVHIDTQRTIGSLVEAGYAAALGKPVFVWFLTEQLRWEYYFLKDLADEHAITNEPTRAWRMFEEFCVRKRL